MVNLMQPQLATTVTPPYQGKYYVAADDDKSLLYLRKDGTMQKGCISRGQYPVHEGIADPNSGYFDTREDALAAIKKYYEKEKR